MNAYVLVKHVCEADLVIGVFSEEAIARDAMKVAKKVDPIEGYTIELWAINGEFSDYVAHA